MVRPSTLLGRFKALVFFLALIWLPSESQACRLALVLAMDVSRSVDSTEYHLQFQGLADAFRDQGVRTAIFAQGGPVAAAAFHWSGETRHAIVADWLILSEASDIDRFARQIESHQREDYGGKTAIGSAVVYARELLTRGPDCVRRVIDVSGDGYHNDGPPPIKAYGDGAFRNVTVNALVIGGLERPALKRHFENEVIHGDGAFAISTQDFTDYAAAIREKLLRELTPRDVIASAKGR